MCWKQEWAMAINNLNFAIEHVERARVKLSKRLLRNEATLQKLRQNKKHNYPKELEPVEARVQKNRKAEAQCRQIVADFKERQDQLFRMIHDYGITHSENPKRVYSLMGRYHKDRSQDK